MKILRINMSRLETTYEDLPEAWKIIGGRGLSAKILTAEVPSDTDPLSPEAKLIIATGPLAGTLAPSCGRVSIGAKSPLTMGIKEANAGGPVGQKLDKLGIRAIVVEGVPAKDKLYLLSLTKDGASLETADDLRGMGNYGIGEVLRKKYGEKTAIMSIGVIGERKQKSASVAFTDKDSHASRQAARGGLGAVMGAKGLKAIVVDDSGTGTVTIEDKDAYKLAIKKWPAILLEDGQVQGLSQQGTPLAIAPLRLMGSMPSKNYSSEETVNFENIDGSAINKALKERGGRMDACMPGCLVKCSVVYNDPDGKHLTSSFEYETLAMLGTNLGITDLDAIAHFERACDDMGIDTVELGSALGVAASAGKFDMGDIGAVQSFIEEVEKGSAFGSILADGVVATARDLGVTRIPAFKGQAIPAHDARVSKATGVTYHTSPMGADHTAGYGYDDFMNPEGKVEQSLKLQIVSAMIDTLGYCLLATPPSALKELAVFLKDLINARYGLNLGIDDLANIGRETLKDELRYNEGAEFSTMNEPDPEFVRNEPVAPMNAVFDVDADQVAALWEKLDTLDVLG